eukprot:3054180-Pleurochrysis_carterae.AAC.1
MHAYGTTHARAHLRCARARAPTARTRMHAHADGTMCAQAQRRTACARDAHAHVRAARARAPKARMRGHAGPDSAHARRETMYATREGYACTLTGGQQHDSGAAE